MISRWHLDVALHTCKAFVPFQDELRRLKRRLVPYKTDEAMDRGLLQDGLQAIRALKDAGAKIEDSVVLEIGSGWHPVIPLLFVLAGARRVMMTDEVRLMDASLLASAWRFLERNSEQLAVHDLKVPHGWPPQGANDAATFEQLLGVLGFEYLVPFQMAGVADRSVDFVVSRAVLEHIPPKILRKISTECRRVLKPNGCVCHIVDNTDHYAHGDHSINFMNFLRFEEWQWRLLTIDRLSYTNRLRHSDYRKLLQESGFNVVKENKSIDRTALAALPSMRLASCFKGRESEDLATATSLFVARAQ